MLNIEQKINNQNTNKETNKNNDLQHEALSHLAEHFEKRNMTFELDQIQSMADFANQRKHIRHQVDKVAWFEFGGQAAVFTCRDLSEGGCFVEPEYSYLDGEYVKPDDYFNMFFIGDEFIVVIVDGIYEYHHKAIIRWIGDHTKHGCNGFGLEFIGDAEKMLASERR